jgi:hypothetical protein
MKFMFMIYHDEKVLDALPEGEMQSLVDSALDYSEELRRSGHYIVSKALQRARTARTIRVRPGKTAPLMARSPRRRSSWADSSSSRRGTWTRRARLPRGPRRRASGSSKSARFKS